ncbi:DNA repair protein RAD16 [Diplocarpon rosae]|nr:DNA repair protein RAD16 [Diplocarpon rosae]
MGICPRSSGASRGDTIHCHIALAIDLEQPDIEQDEQQVKKSSIINRIKMENWTSSSKIETLEKKANMINSTINADQKAMENLTPQDLQFLFRGS